MCNILVSSNLTKLSLESALVDQTSRLKLTPGDTDKDIDRDSGVDSTSQTSNSSNEEKITTNPVPPKKKESSKGKDKSEKGKINTSNNSEKLTSNNEKNSEKSSKSSSKNSTPEKDLPEKSHAEKVNKITSKIKDVWIGNSGPKAMKSVTTSTSKSSPSTTTITTVTTTVISNSKSKRKNETTVSDATQEAEVSTKENTGSKKSAKASKTNAEWKNNFM